MTGFNLSMNKVNQQIRLRKSFKIGMKVQLEKSEFDLHFYFGLCFASVGDLGF